MDMNKFAVGKIQNNLNSGRIVIILMKDGPLHIQGPLEIRNPEGEVCYKGNQITLCRCGRSAKMPFCDGSHLKAGFKTNQEIVLVQKEEKFKNY